MNLLGSSFLVALLLTGCVSQKSIDDHAEMRRQRLLEMYPVGKTTRKDIEARFKGPPQVRAHRPAAGWEAYPDRWVSSYAVNAEKRINRKIPEAERYFGADGMFSLCYCWFYYDSRQRLIDAEWQWSSD